MSSENEFQLLPKHELMSKLEEYDNLVNAMSALFFVSRGMQHIIPVVFQAWREHTLQRHADKIQDILSSFGSQSNPSIVASGPAGVSQIPDAESGIEGTQTEEYFDNNEVEEYIQVKDSQNSAHILPLSNTKFNSTHSQYQIDDDFQSQEVIDDESSGIDQQK